VHSEGINGEYFRSPRASCQHATFVSNDDDAQLAYFGITLSMATRDGDLPERYAAVLPCILLLTACDGGYVGGHAPLFERFDI